MKPSTAVEKWDAWKDAGNEPATRAAAFNIVSESLDIPVAKLKNAYSKEQYEDGTEKLSNALSILVWDLTENGGRLFNYDKDTALFQNLLTQATYIIFTATRKAMSLGKRWSGTVPTVVDTPNGAMLLRNMTVRQLESIAERFVIEARNMLQRWQAIGADPRIVVRVLRDLANELEVQL